MALVEPYKYLSLRVTGKGEVRGVVVGQNTPYSRYYAFTKNYLSNQMYSLPALNRQLFRINTHFI